MSRFVEYDPTTGVEMLEDVYDTRQQFHYRQDVEPLLDLTKKERDYGLTDHGIKKDLWLYARIPPVIILEMKHRWGVDIFSKDKGHLKKALDIINEHYPHLKCTEKHHEIRN